MNSCPSDLRWDAWDAGELPPAERETIESHAAGCATCQQRLDALAARRQAFSETPELRALGLQLASEAPARPWWQLALAPALAVGIAALALVLWRPGGPPAPSAIRMKGALTLVLHRQTAAGSEALDEGAIVHPGDRLGFRVRTDLPGHVALLVRDGAGQEQRLLPRAASAPQVALGSTDLDVAVVLDATRGATRFLLLRCETPPRTALAFDSRPQGCKAAAASVFVQ